jgi:hypothetical protein
LYGWNFSGIGNFRQTGNDPGHLIPGVGNHLIIDLPTKGGIA